MTRDPYRTLEAGPVRAVVARLQQRMLARFPNRDLPRVAEDLLVLIDEVEAGSSLVQGRARAARLVSRTVMLLVLAATLLALAIAARDALTVGSFSSSLDLLPLIETVINDVVFAGIAVYFLYSFPERLQRGRTLALLHRLRSLAHVVDMHQLSKDPEQLRPGFVPTAVSEPLDLTRDEMERYLDYCSELLSLIGKTAALCAEESRDAIVLSTVSTIESLTTGMSRKIWQKISMLSR